MKKIALLLTLVLGSAALWAADKAPLDADGRKAQWKKVEAAVKKGLPKTAIQEIEPIIDSAMNEKAYAEAIKAIAQKIALEGNIQGNKPQEKITRMQAAIAEAPPEMVPVMDAVLANWYWHYFQQNRWRFMNRTATSEVPSDDFTTWSLPRIFAEIDKQFTKALAGEKVLKATPVADYNDLLVQGTVPDSYRPTMYDFLAHNALAFYNSGEQAAARPSDAFDLMADSPVFATAEPFMAWKVETTDESSPVVKAIRLYQDLLAFHKDDENKKAFIDCDLARLQFGINKAFGEEKNARGKAALKKFVDRWGDDPISARALYQWAAILQGEGDLVAGRKLALRGSSVWPNSIGGRQCYNLVQQIESKSSQVTTERVWTDPWPTIDVRYKNVTKIYLRAVRHDYNGLLKSKQYRPEQLNKWQRAGLLTKKPDHTWSADLPATEDYHERVEKLPVPKDLKPGFYFLIASHDPKFGAGNNVVSFADFWVSNLALVIRTNHGDAKLSGFVLDARTGRPINGAKVHRWRQVQHNKRVAEADLKTDENGLFSFTTDGRHGYILIAEHKGQQLAASNIYSNGRYDYRPKPSTQTIFFTDRSLYRPGQTVQYKGICIRVDQQKDSYETISGQSMTVVFVDRNGKEIARQKQRSNDYGSISGSFTAPRDRLMGRMSLRVEGGPRGQAAFNVEEYKRPKFQVELAAPKVAPKLGAEVKLEGKATAYTGAAIGGAKVRWRVVREVRYPPWWGWCYWWRTPKADSQEIAHGSATTGSDGKFPITFTAKADLSVAGKDEPTFQYTIHADVTDTSGETRSDQRTVRVGYTALAATMSAGSWLTAAEPVAVAVHTATLDGEAQQAEGSLKIHALIQPDKVHRTSLTGRRYPPPFPRGGADAKPKPDPSNVHSWALGEVVAERGFTTDATGKASYKFKLKPGIYRAILTTRDRFGKEVTAQLPLQILQPDAKKLNIRIPNLVAAPKWSVEPGEEFSALWGTGYDTGQAFIEIEHRGKILQSYWTGQGRTQAIVKQAVTEAMRGGFTLRVTMVRENRAYLTSHRVTVPWSNKQLTVKWEHFTSKLMPGQKETWTAIVTGPDAKKAVAEMVATLYDESLDAYLPHHWMTAMNVFRQDSSRLHSRFENAAKHLQHLQGSWPRHAKGVDLRYRSFPHDIIANLWGYQAFGRMMKGGGRGFAPGRPELAAAPMAMEAESADFAGDGQSGENLNARRNRKSMAKSSADKKDGEQAGGAGAPKPDLSKVTARKNLNETAFFFPKLLSGKDGTVRLEFTMPEALTKWKFMGFAHDTKLRSGSMTGSTVTAKDLMVEPNAPRFVRESDTIEFTVKVSNQSAARQTGTVRLTLADARTNKSVDAALGNNVIDQTFDIPSKESRTFSWRLHVPDGMGFLTYKAVGGTGKLSDGEEGYLPVLPRRILVTESLPLPIRGPETKKFTFTKLLESGKSDSLSHQSLTVQMVSNPSWYAVMALPYLMEYPHQCTEQTFNRLYANALARHIANSDPKIRRIFDQWKGTKALDSPLEKNQDLKAVMLEETPWYKQAQSESQARRNVGILFDDNRLNEETARLLRKLAEMQLADGAWPWFPGGRGNDYITLYITTGFGRMRHLGVDVDVTSAVKSLNRLDAWIDRTYREILKHGHKDKNHLSSTIALYLYGRSFFLEDKPIAANHREAVDYFLGQTKKYWLQLANRQSQGHLAIAAKRFGDKPTAVAIMRSIKERSVSDDELGMFWRDTEASWWWYRAPIETQALMIEAFDEVMGDAVAVEDCKVWLLKQKQTQDWKTTKATADAVYALLLRGTDGLASDELVEVSLGGVKIEPKNVEAGTGFYEQRFVRGEVKPKMGKITVKKIDKGVAWGSVHWQYLEDMSKITPYEGTPLKLTKSLYTRVYTKAGPELRPVAGPLSVGDELVVRITLKVDRAMEYVHLKDQRGSGTEPVNVLSRYKYQDGLAYYESTRDTASHFFIDYLPKGVYVFEYSTRVVHRGEYQTGMAQIQCMYAPEFNSHSESFKLVVGGAFAKD